MTYNIPDMIQIGFKELTSISPFQDDMMSYDYLGLLISMYQAPVVTVETTVASRMFFLMEFTCMPLITGLDSLATAPDILRCGYFSEIEQFI